MAMDHTERSPAGGGPDPSPVRGPIEFYPDDTVTMPLWDLDGLLPDDPDWLATELGLSRELIADLEAWARDWDAPPTRDPEQVGAWLDQIQQRRTAGQGLFERLEAELSQRFQVVNRFNEPPPE